MGVDIALGLMVLVGGVRGWFRGFTIQAIRLTSLVGSVYAASPIRDLVKPYVLTYLSSVPPYLLDRLLWWSAAGLTYLVTTGLGGLLVKLYRKKPYGEPEPHRGDQMAGFLLAGVKTAIVASFMMGAFERNALNYARQLPGLEAQIKESMAFSWNTLYRPAERIWALPPVQEFVAQVRRHGVTSPTDQPASPLKLTDEIPPVQTAANRTPTLDLPTIGVDPELAQEIEKALRQP